MPNFYGIPLSYIFEMPLNSDENPSISNQKPCILVQNHGFWSKVSVFRIKKFKMIGFRSEIPRILTRKPVPGK